jgi:predicted flap endonuclease-1-like 5' DNA nuclease
MSELLQTYWPLIVAALVLGLAVAWYVFNASRKTRITGTSRDVLDEGAAPAERNKALIDSAPAATPMQPAAGVPATPAASGDDLTRIKGLGPKLSATLRGMGVTTFAQIAAWDDAEIDRVDAQMGRFQGRIRRDDWVGQAAMLAAGDEAGFADRFGKLS